MAPFSWNGSEFIYHRVLKPWVKEHREKIDEYLEKAKERASHLYDEGMDWAKRCLQFTCLTCSLFMINFDNKFEQEVFRKL